MKVNDNIVAVFEIIDGKIEFLGLSKNFKEDYKITTVTTNREIYYKELDECEDYELNLIIDKFPKIYFYMYENLLNDYLNYFFTTFKNYDINYEKRIYFNNDYISLFLNDDSPDLLLRIKEVDEVGLAIYFPENLSIIEDFTSYYERDGVKYKRVKVNSFAEFKKIVDEYFKK